MSDRRISRLSIIAGLIAAPAIAAAATPTTIPDLLDRAALAFTKGLAASDSERPHRRSLEEAARTLEALGATPADPAARDLAVEWRKMSGYAAGSRLRGRGLGPGYRHMRLVPDQSVTLDQIFMGGELARVVVAPGKGARLVLETRDREGQQICRTLVTTRPGGCDWTPVFTARYQLEVRSMTKRPAQFVLLTN